MTGNNQPSHSKSQYVPRENRTFVWIADYNNNRVVKLADDGTWLATISGFNRPRAIEVDPANGDVWVADTTNDRVVKLSSNIPHGYSTSVKKITDDSTSNRNAGLLYFDASVETGQVNGALSLDGVDDYVEVPDSESLRISNYTVEIWFKPNGIPNEDWKGIIGKPGRNFNIWLNRAGYIHHRFHTSAYWNGGAPDTPSGSITWDAWNHVAITNDGTTAKTYINGIEQASGPSGGPQIIDRTSLLIGKNLDGSAGAYFNGLIDEVRIWNVARSETEIANNKDAELTGSEPGLVGYWKLNATPDTPYHQIVGGFDDPYYLSLDPKDGSVWVTDYGNKQVVKLSSDGTELKRVDGFNVPRRVSVFHKDGSVWVTDSGNDDLVKLDSNGNELKRIGGFSEPVSVSVDQTDGAVYVTDYYNNRVVKYASDGTEVLRSSAFYRPLSVSVNQSDRTVWVAQFDSNEVVKLTPSLAELFRSAAFNHPHDLRANPDDGTVWVTDHQNHQMVKLAPDGKELLKVGGFYYPVSLSLDTTSKKTNEPPTAAASANPTTGDAALSVQFTGSATDDGTIVLYEWDFDGDGTYDYESGSTGNTTHVYSLPGTYNPIFRVTDNEGMTGYDASLTVHVGPLSVYATVSPATGNAPLTVTLNASVKGLAAGARISSYEWDFEGDGIYDFKNSESPKTNHTYPFGRDLPGGPARDR